MPVALPTKQELLELWPLLNPLEIAELDWLGKTPTEQARTKPGLIADSDDALYWYLRDCLGFQIARKPICEHHTAPFQFIADLYFQRVQRAVGLGPRGGGKTRLLSLLWWIRACHERLHIFHCGGVEEQAKRGYEYLREYIDMPQFKGMIDARHSLMSETRWPTGARLEIHAATMNQTSGAHPDLKVGDELEKWAYPVYQQFLGMGTSENVQTVFISTREKAFGLMQQVLDEAPQRDIKVYSWCVWETKVPCPTCSKAACPLWEPCQGRYKDSQGHRSVKNIADKYLLSSTETWESQHECKRPGSQGLCFPNLVTEPGTPETSNVTEAAVYNPEYPIEVWCDDNVAAPRAMLYVQEGYINGVKRLWGFGESYEPGRLQAQDVEETIARLPKKPELAVVPNEATALKIAWWNVDIQTVSPKNYRRVEGVNVLNQFIRDAHGQRLFLLHPDCVNFIRSLRKSHRAEVAPGVYGEEPVKEPDDHGSDACMYGCYRRRYEQ